MSAMTVNAVRSVDPIDAHDVVRRRGVGTDERDQRIRGAADERDVDRAADADDRRRQAGGERRHCSGLRIDARNSAGRAFRHIECAAGPHRAARRALQSIREELGRRLLQPSWAGRVVRDGPDDRRRHARNTNVDGCFGFIAVSSCVDSRQA